MPHATSRSAVLVRPLPVKPFPIRAFVTSTFLFAAFLLGAVPASTMVTEEPKFDVVSKEGDYELRQFAPMMIAETFADGNKDDASSRGFKAIAGYIFGAAKTAELRD